MIVVAGEALVDLVINPDGSVAAKLGGGPYNVARTIGRLGRAVSFLGAVSTDRFGEQLFAHLCDDGVNPDATVRTDLPTTLAAAELDESGSAAYHFYLQGTSSPALDHVPAAAVAPEAVHAGTLGLVLEPMATTLIGYLAGLPANVVVMIDPNCRSKVIPDHDAYTRRIDDVYARADIVKISSDDAEYLAPHLQPIDYARSVVERGVPLVLLTGGGAGTWVIGSDAQTEVPTTRIEVVDTIGAGDSFGGAFLTWWLDARLGRDDLSDHAAAVLATSAAQEVAAFTCQQAGAEPPRREQLSPRWQHPSRLT